MLAKGDGEVADDGGAAWLRMPSMLRIELFELPRDVRQPRCIACFSERCAVMRSASFTRSLCAAANSPTSIPVVDDVDGPRALSGTVAPAPSLSCRPSCGPISSVPTTLCAVRSDEVLR